MKMRVFFPLCLAFFASVAFASPIHVSGSGTFVADPVSADSSFTISFSGSDGVDSITLNANCGGGGWGFFSVSGPVGHCTGGATIDGLMFGGPAGTFSFAVGNGSGFANGSNPALNQFASVSLIGYVNATTQSCIGTGPGRVCSGTFTVDPTPEPGSLALGLLGFGAIAVRIANRRIRSNATEA